MIESKSKVFVVPGPKGLKVLGFVKDKNWKDIPHTLDIIDINKLTNVLI